MRTTEAAIRGTITEILSGGRYMVLLDDNRRVIAHISGKMRFNHIRLLLADKVDVIVDPFGGHASNRIVKRL